MCSCLRRAWQCKHGIHPCGKALRESINERLQPAWRLVDASRASRDTPVASWQSPLHLACWRGTGQLAQQEQGHSASLPALILLPAYSQARYSCRPAARLATPAGPDVPSQLQQGLKGAALAIWTTTPWTIPANAAVAVNADLQYVLVEAEVRD